MTEAEWMEKIKAQEAQAVTVEEWETEATPVTPATPATAAPVTIVYNDNRVTYNIVQTAISGGNTMPAPQIRIVEDSLTKYLPSNYQSGNMDELAAKIAANPNYAHTPMTKEERAVLGDYSGYSF